MIPERLAKKARAAIEALASRGSLEGASEQASVFRELAGDARAIGLFELAERLAAVAAALETRGASPGAPSAALADALLGSYDRVEALSAMLSRAALLRAFGVDEEAP